MDGYWGSSSEASPFAFDDSWIKGSVKIPLPCDGVQQSEAEAPRFIIEVYHWKLLDIIKAALGEPSAERFHIFPSRAFWQPGPDEAKECIYFEIYTGDCWNEEYAKIHIANHQQGLHCNFEALLIGLMIWSDVTLLAQFGNVQLWPIYLYIRNQFKYSWAKPSSFAAHHVAYIPKVRFFFAHFIKSLILGPARWQDSRILHGGFWKGRHCSNAYPSSRLRRELVQAIWILLLDDEFMHAYIHGFLFQLADGIQRVLFPRFMTYSADYPEK